MKEAVDGYPVPQRIKTSVHLQVLEIEAADNVVRIIRMVGMFTD